MAEKKQKPKAMSRADFATCRNLLKEIEKLQTDRRDYLEDMCDKLSGTEDGGENWWPDRVHVGLFFADVDHGPGTERVRLRVPDKYRPKLKEFRTQLDAKGTALDDHVVKIANRNFVLSSSVNPKTGELGERTELGVYSGEPEEVTPEEVKSEPISDGTEN